MGRGVDFQEIPLIAALIEADAPLGVADQLKFGLLQLEIVHIEPLIHTAGVEEELVEVHAPPHKAELFGKAGGR